jgi:uncharacterized protein YbbC (DUF1343 family)
MLFSCGKGQPVVKKNHETTDSSIVLASNRTYLYLPYLINKKVGVVANQTSVLLKSVKNLKESELKNEFTHLVDSLLNLNITIEKVFSPEHGFRGMADAAEEVSNEIDKKTGLPIISLYGKKRKPSKNDLSGIEVMIFDIQDVGVRFYTYLSTLHYVMEACAENNIPLILLDRPNPNGYYIDGPMLQPSFKSFLGMHPVPLVYGMTIGEYAQMINGEQWLKNNIQCDLTVIPLKNYKHADYYDLPIKPSPNLPNSQAINLYPSLGFFEGTSINAGRGTEFQFQRYGATWFPESGFAYTPKPNDGAKNPKHNGLLCYGVDLSEVEKLNHINIKWLKDAYEKTPSNKKFFGSTFNKHVGNDLLFNQLKKGVSEGLIKASWKKEIDEFKEIRKNYLIYKE